MRRSALVLCLELAVVTAACAPAGNEGRSAPGNGAPGQPRGEDREARRWEREHMVRTQLAARGIRDDRVLAAMAAVPREWFVPPAFRDRAYEDSALPLAAGQTISQPYIVALMTEAVALRPGARVLEIGTGSGYQAAVLAELTPHVHSIEYVPELAAAAERTLREHGYDRIALRQGDGFGGWPEAAPFDAILVTAAPPDVPQPLVDQLRPGGRLCIPVDVPGLGGQELLLLTKRPDGTTTREVLSLVRFVPMVGEARDER